MTTLEGKVVLVTGAAKRIGRSIALALAAEGARVAIHYNGSETEARATAAECGGAPVFHANLESVPEIRAMFDRIAAHFGTVHGLVNNAARFTQFEPLEIEEADWDFIHSVNLKSVFFCCQAAAKIMLAGALLRVEGGRGDVDARAGKSVGSQDLGEFSGSGGDSVRYGG